MGELKALNMSFQFKYIFFDSGELDFEMSYLFLKQIIIKFSYNLDMTLKLQ